MDPTGNNYALVFRGSILTNDLDFLVDWIEEDFNVLARVSWPYASTSGARISKGVDKAFKVIMGMTDAQGSGLSIGEYLLKNTVGNGKRLIITGHSLGGNIANVYASYYVQTLPKGISSDNVSLYTFAAPAAGNPAFAKDLDTKLPAAWHYHNDNDIIPNFAVPDRIAFTGSLYSPQPAAAKITTTYKGKTVSLQKLFPLLAALFTLDDYQQPANNYTFFKTQLNTNHEANTLKGWLGQAGAQHQITNYAEYLGVMLPSMPPLFSLPPVPAV
jgi:predicted lipase